MNVGTVGVWKIIFSKPDAFLLAVKMILSKLS